MTIINALKGISGEFEIGRILGAAGVGTYIVTAPSFMLWDVVHTGKFDVVAFCAAYPAGLGVAMGAVAGSIALKDRSVAKAQETTANAAATTAAAAGPVSVVVTNAADAPVPVESAT